MVTRNLQKVSSSKKVTRALATNPAVYLFCHLLVRNLLLQHNKTHNGRLHLFN